MDLASTVRIKRQMICTVTPMILVGSPVSLVLSGLDYFLRKPCSFSFAISPFVRGNVLRSSAATEEVKSGPISGPSASRRSHSKATASTYFAVDLIATSLTRRRRSRPDSLPWQPVVSSAASQPLHSPDAAERRHVPQSAEEDPPSFVSNA